MPDINEIDIFKNDIDRENTANFNSFFGDIQPATPIASVKPDFVGSFNDGLYKPKVSTEPASDEDLFSMSARKFDPAQAKAIFNPYVDVNKDFNSGFDNYEEKKYANGKYGFDLTKTLAENEQMYFKDWDKQNFLTKGVKTIGTMATNVVAKAGLKFAEGLGYLGSAVNPMNYGEDFFLKVADNGFSKFFNNMSEGLKDDALTKTFRPSDYDQRGFFSKMGTSEFWGNEAADGFAFMLSAMIPVGGIFSRVGKGLGLVAKGAEAAQFAGRLGEASNLIFGSKEVAAPIQWAYSVASESFFEAKGVVDDLNQRRKDPLDPLYNMGQAEFDTYKNEKAANTFKGNVALLSLTNLFQTKLLFKALGKSEPAAVNALIDAEQRAISKTYSNKLSKFFNGTRLGRSATGLAEGTLMEGYLEENAQLAIERINSSNNKEYLHFNPNDNGFTQFVSQLTGQTAQASTVFGGSGDTELSTSIGLGGIMGGGMSVANTNLQRRQSRNGEAIDYSLKDFYKGWGYGELNNKKDNDAMVFAGLENQYNKWQDAKVVSDLQAKYKSLQTKLTAATPEERNSIQVDMDNISKQYLATTYAAQSKAKGLTDQTILAEQLEATRPIEASILRNQAFTNYFISANNAGLGEGMFESLRSVMETPTEELKQFGLDPDSISEDAHQQYIKIAETILNSAKNPELNMKGFRRGSGLFTYESLNTLNENRKNRILNHELNSVIYGNAIDSYNSKINETKPHAPEFPELTNLQEGYNKFAQLSSGIVKAQQLIDSGTVSKSEVEYQKSHIDSIKNQMSLLKRDPRYKVVNWDNIDTEEPSVENLLNIDEVGNLNVDPELTEAEQQKAKTEYANLMKQQLHSYKDGILQNARDSETVWSYIDAARYHRGQAETLTQMDADQFLTYIKEQQELDKESEEVAPSVPEATQETTEETTPDPTKTWSIKELSSGKFIVVDQNGNPNLDSEGKTIEYEDQDFTQAVVDQLNTKPEVEQTEQVPTTQQTQQSAEQEGVPNETPNETTTTTPDISNTTEKRTVTTPITSSNIRELKPGQEIFDISGKKFTVNRVEGNKVFTNEGLSSDINFIELFTRTEVTQALQGIESIFTKSSELSKVGTLEEYRQYLSGIFPDSKIKDILYHGTRTQERFEQFDSNKIGELDSGYFGRGFYFSPDIAYAEGYSKQYNGYTVAAIVNLTNPLETDANQANTNVSFDNNDGAIVRVGENLSPELDNATIDPNEIGEVVVKIPTQIHILASNKDIEGFKKFVKDQTSNLDELFDDITPEEYLKNGQDIAKMPDTNERANLAKEFLSKQVADARIGSGMSPEVVASFSKEPFIKLLNRIKAIVLIQVSKTKEPEEFLSLVNTYKKQNKFPDDNELNGIVGDIQGQLISDEDADITPPDIQTPLPESVQVSEPVPALAILSSNKTTIRNTEKEDGKDKKVKTNNVQAAVLTKNKHTLFMQEVLPELFTKVNSPASPFEFVVVKDKVGDQDNNPEWEDNSRYDDIAAAKRNLGIVIALVRKGESTPVRLSKNEDGELEVKNYSTEEKNGFLATYQIDKDAFSIKLSDKYDAIRRIQNDNTLTDEYIRENFFNLNEKNEIKDRLKAIENLNSTDRIIIKPTILSEGLSSGKPTPVNDLFGDKDFSIELPFKNTTKVPDGTLAVRLNKNDIQSSVPVYPSTVAADKDNGNREVYDKLAQVFQREYTPEELNSLLPALKQLFYFNKIIVDGKTVYSNEKGNGKFNLVVINGKLAVGNLLGKRKSFENLRINPLVSHFREDTQITIPQIDNNQLDLSYTVDPQEYFKNSVYTYYRPVTKDGKTLTADSLQQYMYFDYNFVEPDLAALEDDYEANRPAQTEEEREAENEAYSNEKAKEELVEQIIEKKTTNRKRRINDLLDDLGTKAQIAPTVPDRQSLVSNPKEAKQYIKDRFPQVPVEVIDGFIKIGDEKALGVFATNLVKLSSLAGKESAYHESFHIAFNLFLTKKQQEDILNEASALYSIKRDSTQSIDRAFQSFEQGSGYYNQQINDVQLEEKLAFEFQKMTRNSDNLTLSEKLSKWLGDLWSKIKSFLTGTENIRNLFNRIESGDFANSTTNYTAGDITRLSIYDQDGKQIMSLPKAEYYSGLANQFLYDLFTDPDLKNASTGQITVNDLKNPRNAAKIYNYIKGNFEDELEDSTDPTFKKDLQIILDNWSNFIQYHLNRKTINLDLDIDELEKTEEEPETGVNNTDKDEEVSKLTFDRPGNDSSTYDAISFKLKNIFTLLPKMQVNPESNGKNDLYIPVTDENGTHIPTDVTNLIDYVASKMAGEIDPNRFFQTLFGTFDNEQGFVPSELMVRNPDIFGLYKLLPQYNKTNPSLDETLLVTEFFRIFSKPKVPLYSIITETGNGNPDTFAREATVNNRFKIQDAWQSDWMKNLYGTVENGVKYYQVTGAKDSLQLLKEIGFVLSPDAIKENEQDIRDIVKEFKSEFIERKENPIQTLRNNEKGKVKSAFYRLLDIESRYSTISPTLGVVNSEGELRYSITEHNTLTNYAYWYNRSNTLDELYTNLPHLKANDRFEKSFTRQYLFDKAGNRMPGRTFYIRNYSEFVKKNPDGSRVIQNTNKLSKMDKFIMDVQGMMAGKMIDIPRNESKQSFYSFGIDTGSGVNPHYFTPKNFQGGYTNTKLSNYIKELYSVTGDKGQLSALSFIKSKDTIDTDIENYFKGLVDDFRNEIKTTVGTIPEFRRLVGEHIIDKSTKDITNQDQKFDAFIKTFVVNKFVNDMEYMLSVAGPMEYYGALAKRLPAWTSTGTPVMYLPITQNYLNNNNSNRLGKDPIDVNDNTIKVNVVNDNVVKPTDKEHVDFVNSILDNFDNAKEREDLRKLLESNINVADGQGYINLDYYKHFLINAGRWNPEMDVAYDYEVLAYKQHKETITEDELERFNSLEKLIYSQGNHNFTLPVLKFQNSGFIIGTDKPAFHKFSLAPLLPSHLITGSVSGSQKLLKELENQVEKGIAYTTHESGSKLQNAGINSIGNSDVLTKLLLDGLKEQLKTDNHQKVEVITGSQFRKLLFNSLYGYGKTPSAKMQQKNKEYLDLTQQLIELSKQQLFNKLGIEFKDGQIYLKDFSKLSAILQKEMTKKGMNTNVKSALDVDKNGKLVNQFEFTGMVSPIMDTLFGTIDKIIRVQKTTGNQMVQVSNAYHESLPFYKLNKKEGKIEKAGVRLTLTSEFRKLLKATHPDGKTIDTLKRLNEALRNETWVKKYENSITIIGYRIPTQSQSSMEFAIVKEFLPPTSGNVIQLYDQITLKSGADFDIDKLFVLYPSLEEDGNYLNDKTDKEYLQEAEEIRTELEDFYKAFQISDYNTDIDSDLYDSVETFTNSIFGQQNSTRNITAQLSQDIDKLWRKVDYIRNHKKNAIQNRLLQTYVDILSDPSQFKALVTPNNTDFVFDVIAQHALEVGITKTKDLKAFLPKGSDNLNYVKGSLNVFDLMMGQKSLLGVAAKQNTLFSQIQQGRFDLKVFRTLKDDKNKEVKLQQLFFPLRFEDNNDFVSKNPDTVPLNKGVNKYGQDVNTIFDQFISAFVDAASNPKMGESGINKDNINIVYYLLMTGTDFKTIIDFVNLPVLREFYLLKNKGLNNSKAYNKLVYKYDPKNKQKSSLYLSERVKNYTYYDSNYINQQKISQTDNQFALQMLANFRHFQQVSGQVGNYTSNKNYDTSKVESHLTAHQRIHSTSSSGYFTETSRTDFEKSLIYKFNIDEDIVDITSQVIPIFANKQMNQGLLDNFFTNPSYNGLPQNLKQNFPKIVMQDMITAITQTYGTAEGENLQVLGQKYISNPQESFYHDFRELVNNYPELYKRLSKKNDLLENIFFESDGKFKLIVDRNNKEVVADKYITQLQTLTSSGIGQGGVSAALRQEMDKIGDVKSYINNLFTKFSIASFTMGGFSKGRYNITQMLPQDVMIPLYKKAVNTFEKLSKEEKTAFLSQFETRFRDMNPKYDINTEAEDKVVRPTPAIKNYNLNSDRQLGPETSPTSVEDSDEDIELANMGIDLPESSSGTLEERLRPLNTTIEDVYQMLTTDYPGTVAETLKGNEVLAQEIMDSVEGNSSEETNNKLDC